MRGSTLDGVLRLFGIPIGDDDARRLIATLLAEGSPDALTAAQQITKGVERDLSVVGLTAVLACLEDPPVGLVELRGALLREHRGGFVVCPGCWQREIGSSRVGGNYRNGGGRQATSRLGGIYLGRSVRWRPWTRFVWVPLALVVSVSSRFSI